MARTKQTARKTENPNVPSRAHNLLKAVAAAQAFQQVQKRIRKKHTSMEGPSDLFSGLENIEDVSKQPGDTGPFRATRTPFPQPLSEAEQQQRVLEEQQRQIEEEARRRTEQEQAPLSQQLAEDLRVAFEEEQEAVLFNEQEQDLQATDFYEAEAISRREEQDRLLAQQLHEELERHVAQPPPKKQRIKICVKRTKERANRQRDVDMEEEQQFEEEERQRERREQEQRERERREQEEQQRIQEERRLKAEQQKKAEASKRRRTLDPAEQERRKKFRNDRQPWEERAHPPPPPVAQKKRKWKPGTVALREIRKYQKSTDPIIAKAPFARVVKEIIDKYSDRVTRVQSTALGALQEASETILVSLFQDSVLCHAHAKRVTLKPVDMALALRLRQDEALHREGFIG